MVTLGVASVCTNVTSLTIPVCNEQEYGKNKWRRYCNYTTPGGVSVFSQLQLRYKEPVTLPFLNTSALFDIADNGFNDDHDMLRTAIFRSPLRTAPAVADANAASQLPRQGEIYECRVNYVGYAYEEVEVRNHTVNMGTVTTIPLKNTSIANLDAGISGVGYYIFTNRSAVKDSISTSPLTFKVNSASAFSIMDHMQNFLTTDGLAPGTLADSNGNVSSIFDNMALSLTARIQRGPNAVEIKGHAFAKRTYFYIQWAWLSLPLLVVLTAAALVVTMVVIERRALIWKSSSLAILFHTLDTGGIEQPTTWSRQHLEKFAKRMDAKRSGGASMVFTGNLRSDRETGASVAS